MATREDPELRAAVLGSDFAVPDGQPLVWALNLLGHELADSRLRARSSWTAPASAAPAPAVACTSTAGADQGALVQLTRNLRLRHPGLRDRRWLRAAVPGADDAEEEAAVVADIARSGAEVVWVGIGVPKQEKWMARDERAAAAAACWSASAPRSTSTAA